VSESVSAVFYIKCISIKQCKNLKKYLNEKTRPKFDEAVQEEELPYVEPFEFLENPDSIVTVDNKTLIVGFYPDDTDFSEAAEELIDILLETVEVESILYCELCYEYWTKFEYYTKDLKQLLWEVELFESFVDKKKTNRFLSDEKKKVFGTILLDDEEQGVEKVLIELSKELALSEGYDSIGCARN